jgi:hypothetical protein
MSQLDSIARATPGALGARPVPTTTEGAPAPDNSEIRAAADAVLGGLKMSFAAIAANPSRQTADGTVEDTFKKAIAGLPAARRENFARRAKTLVEAPEAQRRLIFGVAGARTAEAHLDAGGFDTFTSTVKMPALSSKLLGLRADTVAIPFTELRTVPDGLLIASPPKDLAAIRERAGAAAAAAGVENERVADVWGAHSIDDPFAEAMTDGEFRQFAPTTNFGLWIERIKCVDETTPEWFGSDEIALGGVSVDATGATKKIAEKAIGGGFDDGDMIGYNNWRYETYSLTKGAYWPKHYSVSFVLAEKDNGGLSSALTEIWAKVKDKVKDAVEKAVAGALAGYVGQAIATAIGKAVAWVVDVLVGWIISLWEDDIFPVFTAGTTVPSMGARWNWPDGTWGNPSSGTRTAHFYGHGGHYRIDYHWKFYA